MLENNAPYSRSLSNLLNSQQPTIQIKVIPITMACICIPY
jgi:hypothetical protein